MINLVIENCNCISHADISIEPNCLNIKYGMNGTGKTTIGKAILLKAQDEQRLTSTLLPYGVNVEEQDKLPKVSNLSFQKSFPHFPFLSPIHALRLAIIPNDL